MAEKLVLACSGGLDTSVVIRWIKEDYGHDLITVTADVGQADYFAEVEKAQVAARAASQTRRAK